MMRPRLEAARRVLRETGAIFVSIDDNEVAHLRLLMDEVFGEPTSSPRSWSTSTPRAASSARASRPATSTSSSTPGRRRSACSTPAARTPSTSATSRWPTPTAGATGTCRCATPTRSSTRSPRAPCTSRSGATPRPAGCATAPFDGRSRWSRCSATDAGGVALEPAADRRAARRPGLPPDQGPARRAGRRVPEGLAARRSPQEAAHDLAGRGDRVHRHRGRRAQGDRRPRLRVAEADRADPPDPGDHARRRAWCSTSSPAAVRRGTRSRCRTPRTAAPARCLSINSAEPTRDGLQRPPRRADDRRRHHPGPAARGRRDGRWRARPVASDDDP